MQTFADQAVLAVENVRLLKDTREALEQQTATAEILRVIASSPADVQPVFEAIVQSGVRLFEGAGVILSRLEDSEVRLMAIAERDPQRVQMWKERFPFPLTREYLHGAAILDCQMVDMSDVEQMADRFAPGKCNFAASGCRAMTVVPMVRDGVAIGTISVVRNAPGPLSDKKIALLKTFADQAVIAIESVRLFNETRDALDQQTAVSDILRVISGSPGHMARMLAAVADGIAITPGRAVPVFFRRSACILRWALHNRGALRDERGAVAVVEARGCVVPCRPQFQVSDAEEALPRPVVGSAPP